MRIRTKLLVLLLGIAVIPLAVVVAFGQISTRKLGGDLAASSRASLTEMASAQLHQLAESRGAIMRRESNAVEIALEFQSREVEELLASGASEADGAEPTMAVAFDGESDPPPGTTTDVERYYRLDEGGERISIPISLETAAFWLAPGVTLDSVRERISKLSRAHEDFRRIRSLTHSPLQWQYFALEEGVHCTYPGHGGYPESYDPRRRNWYVRAIDEGGTVWNPPLADASTRQVMMSLSRPLRGPDGGLAGVTGIDIRLTDIMSGIELPEAWADGARSLFVYSQIPVDGAEPRLVVVAQQGYLRAGASWDAPIAMTVIAERSREFRLLVEALSAGQSGVARLPFDDRDSLWGYSPINDKGNGVLIIVPTDLVLADAIRAEEEGIARTREQLITVGLIFALVAVLVGIAAARGARTVTRPIVELTQAAGSVATGDLSARADVRTGDEIQELAESFNAMVPKLEESLKIRESLQLAMEVQQNLLPERPPRIRGLDIAGASIYCDETGGDYFDFLQFREHGPGRVGIVVGDVSGHGIAPALLMATGRALLRSHATGDPALGALFSTVNRDLANDSSAGRFMTLFYLLLDRPAAWCRWVSAGHEPAIVYDPESDEFSEFAGKGLPLGIDRDWTYPEFSREDLRPGEVVVLGTDGVWEARDPDGEFFGLERLREVVRERAAASAQDILSAVLERLDAFRRERHSEDDVTLVVLKIEDLT